MKQSTTLSTTSTNCFEFEAGDFSLKIPECAMNEGFKTTMGAMVGMSVGVVVIIFGREIIKLLDTNRISTNYYQYQPPYMPMYYYQQ